jgi:ABC-type Zn uptake system ZnuABC Zn-binding protein ZnuA
VFVISAHCSHAGFLAQRFRLALVVLVALSLGGCAAPATPTSSGPSGAPNVLAAETFLADIAQNVAGDRLAVKALIPLGVDPHSFEPTPSDVRTVADSQLLIVNGAGFEAFLEPLLKNAGGRRTVIEAAAGLATRAPQPGEHPEGEADHAEGDPHFWLDPNNVIAYVENIRDGLAAADPAGKEVYAANAAAYISRLKELDAWIKEQVAAVPEARRLLVTNHESFGYFADRYGFRVVGAVIPSVSSAASPSAQQLAHLADQVKAVAAPAVFLEAGASTQLADQLARETGITVVTDLLTHSVTAADGPAPDYLGMMRYDVKRIVDALKAK